MAARLTRYSGAVVVKLGGAGCVLAVPGEAPVLIAAPPVRAIDSTGAGDAFCGAFMSRWLAAVPPAPGGRPSPPGGRPATPGLADLAAAAEYATRVAATVVTRFGARPV
jgi:sugar/nucleoside kinase (ribokinase family)